jgi:hypothetical protein
LALHIQLKELERDRRRTGRIFRMFIKVLFALYWVLLIGIVWCYEKRIVDLEEENRHMKATLDIVKNGGKINKL